MAEVDETGVDEEVDPQDEAKRRLALAQIRQYPDPALRLVAHEVELFDDDLRRLSRRMTGLMQDAHGVGLAATQVGLLQRLFVFQPGDAEPRTIINPRIVERSEETDSDTEGCLSLWGVIVPVERSTEVTLIGHDPDGAELKLELTDHAARIVQHELDHLDGVLIIDRTTPEARKGALASLRPRLSFS
jgi:peptide deformylase